MRNLTRKLFLSICTLAICAVTLVSTTFAWYTGNTEVSASGVTGQATTSGQSLLLISSTGKDGTFSNSVQLTINSTQLIPVEYTAGADTANAELGLDAYEPAFKGWAGDKVGGLAAEGTAYLKFDLYFRGTSTTGSTPSGVNVYLSKLKLTNETGTLPTKDVLSTEGLGDSWNISEKKTYSVDILRTINVAYTVFNQTNNSGTVAETFSSQGVWNPESLVTLKTDSLTNIASFNAHSYLNKVTGSTIGTTNTLSATDLSTSSIINLGTTPSVMSTGNSLHVVLYVFINGWDLACFDAVQGQSIKLELGFTSVKDTTVSGD